MSNYRIIIISISISFSVTDLRLRLQNDHQCFRVPFLLLDTVEDVVTILCY